jgi:hypothetical protein
VFVALALNGCGVPAGFEMWLQIKRYSGDGVIHACSNLLAAGYRIDFPKFDASQPYSASYRLSRVPRVHARGREPIIYLRFDGDRSFPRNGLSDSFRMTLANSKGEVIQAFGRTLHFDKKASYILSVDYVPGQVPSRAKQLYFEIDNCAFY